MEANCVRCGRKVKSEENWLRAHVGASTSVQRYGSSSSARDRTRPPAARPKYRQEAEEAPF